ncbi:hypothetical protein ACIP5Y_21735 [Nocardia sp. NPDC088792]|uniref:hypothetical protein n=1 Tax=Nocardia sp. NPDC088792 TaxID=3364332 RepID=UPI0038007956
MAEPDDRNRQVLNAYTALRKALLLIPPIMIEIPETWGNIAPVDAEKSVKRARKVLADMPGDDYTNTLLVYLILDWLDALYMARMWHTSHDPIHGELVDQALMRFHVALVILDRDGQK